METEKTPETVGSRFDTKITRGTALKTAAVAAGAAALARIQVGPEVAEAAAGGRLPKNVRATISIFGDDYNPTASMVKTPNNPLPIHNLQVVIDQYQRLYPGVKVNVVTPHYANDDRRTWEITQLVGDVAPEILQTPAQAIVPDIGKGWWLNLDPYLAQPNPYIPAGHPGSVHWIDEFYPALTQAQRAPDGHLYALPYDFGTDLVFYNKTMFKQVGATPPTTYTELLAAMAKLQKAGHVAFGARVPADPWWEVGSMVMRRYQNIIKPSGGGGSYTAKDVALAILHGQWGANTPEYANFLQLLKLQIPYWKKDWLVNIGPNINDPTAENEFQQGRIGILQSGFYMISTLDSDGQLPFEWGTFPYPIVTHGTGFGQSPYADGRPAPIIGGADVMYAVTKTATERKNLPVVIDFLRYISAPAQASRIVNELGQKLPMEREVAVNANLRSIASQLTHTMGSGGIFFWQYDFAPESLQKVYTLTTSYLIGQASLNSTVAAIQQEYMRQSKDSAAKYGWK